jgi:hypothetical protein
MHRLAKPAYSQGYRGFESPPLRHTLEAAHCEGGPVARRTRELPRALSTNPLTLRQRAHDDGAAAEIPPDSPDQVFGEWLARQRRRARSARATSRAPRTTLTISTGLVSR